MKEIDFIRNKLSVNGAIDEASSLALYEIERQINLFRKLEESLWNSELYVVYMHTTPDGKKYIGITKNLPNSRWNEGSGYEAQRKFYKAIQAYGWINIEHKIIAAGLTETEAKELETKLIQEYKTIDPDYGYNSNLSVAEDKHADKTSTTRPKQKGIQTRSDLDICREIIEKHSIKSVDKTIYIFNGSEYVKAPDNAIEKEILEDHQVLSPKRRKEIKENIMLLSQSNMEDVFPESFIETAQKTEIQMLLEAFQSSGNKKVTEIDIAELYTWLNETPETDICVPMIWDQVFHLLGEECPLIISRRIGIVLQNNGWRKEGKKRLPKYGSQRCFCREV